MRYNNILKGIFLILIVILMIIFSRYVEYLTDNLALGIFVIFVGAYTVSYITVEVIK